jgi:hypothetical protein
MDKKEPRSLDKLIREGPEVEKTAPWDFLCETLFESLGCPPQDQKEVKPEMGINEKNATLLLRPLLSPLPVFRMSIQSAPFQKGRGSVGDFRKKEGVYEIRLFLSESLRKEQRFAVFFHELAHLYLEEKHFVSPSPLFKEAFADIATLYFGYGLSFEKGLEAHLNPKGSLQKIAYLTAQQYHYCRTWFSKQKILLP